MGAANFPACLKIILASERGYVVDQGGPTMLGVTRTALSSYLRRPVTIAEVKALTPETVAPLYLADYFNLAHCPQLANGLDLMVFDEAVNEGVGRAVRHVQEALGVPADGMFGPISLAAAQAAHVPTLIGALHDANADYYIALAVSYPKDRRGWLARNDRTRDLALEMVA